MMPRVVWIALIIIFISGSLWAKNSETIVAALDDAAMEDALVGEDLTGTPVDNARIEVNIPARQMRLIYEGQEVFKFPIAVGSAVYKTPVGPRELSQIIWNPWWIPPNSEWAKNDKPTPPGPGNPLGPVKMELGGTIRMHGTNKDASVGHPVSHGCMRLHNEDAKTLAWWIQTHFTDKIDPALPETYAAKSRQSFYVKLPRPIPVEIKYDLFELGENILEVYPDFYRHAGDRFGKAIAWLADQGIDTGRLNTKVLKKALSASGRETAFVKMSQLLSGSKSDVALGEAE